MKRLSFIPILIIIVSSFSSIASAQNLAKQVKEFDVYAENAMHQWEVPGMAIVIVKDGKIILEKGYGVREAGKTDLVDTKTVFACASTTKAMTAVCMAMLVDEGKVSWDDHVSKFLPEFILSDPYITHELRIKDLLTHNSGIGQTDYLALMDISCDNLIRRMQYVKPSYSMRSGFVYQNTFYLIAGKVIERITGKSWDSFIKERIFDPLEMNRTFTAYGKIPDQNKSTPHYLSNDTVKSFKTTTWAERITPAGGVRSSIEDMGKWIACMLDSSKYYGGRLLRPETWTELFKPQVIVPPNEFYPTMKLTKPNWTTYGLGWFQQDYKGRKVNFHTGSLEGEIAITGQLPDYKLGIYIFGNLDHCEIRHALMYKAFDIFALGGERDWSKDMYALYKGIRDDAIFAEKIENANRVPDTTPSKPLSEYTGMYSDPLYGEAQVSLTKTGLAISINNVLNATLNHWHYDTFKGKFDFELDGKATVFFSLNSAGRIEKLNIEGMEFFKTEK